MEKAGSAIIGNGRKLVVVPPGIAAITAIVVPSRYHEDNTDIGKQILRIFNEMTGKNSRQINISDLRVVCQPEPEICDAARVITSVINQRAQIMPCEDMAVYSFPLAFKHMFGATVAVMVTRDGNDLFDDFQTRVEWPLKHVPLDAENSYVCILAKEKSIQFHF